MFLYYCFSCSSAIYCFRVHWYIVWCIYKAYTSIVFVICDYKSNMKDKTIASTRGHKWFVQPGMKMSNLLRACTCVDLDQEYFNFQSKELCGIMDYHEFMIVLLPLVDLSRYFKKQAKACFLKTCPFIN